ncbi:MAG TPA: flagellar hook-length control protein FliK [Steroidobacteraceae bacterium]|nr:flagellar hook-length control protein FliK [Steroidobacteraceae bacterium]
MAQESVHAGTPLGEGEAAALANFDLAALQLPGPAETSHPEGAGSPALVAMHPLPAAAVAGGTVAATAVAAATTTPTNITTAATPPVAAATSVAAPTEAVLAALPPAVARATRMEATSERGGPPATEVPTPKIAGKPESSDAPATPSGSDSGSGTDRPLPDKVSPQLHTDPAPRVNAPAPESPTPARTVETAVATAAPAVDAPAAILSRTNSTDATTATLRPEVGTAAWPRDLGQQLARSAQEGISELRLQLNPPHLGPLEVRISMRDAQVGLWFGTHSTEARDALQQSLPSLREMFNSAGLTLGDASIAQQQPGQQGPAPGPARPTAAAAPAMVGANTTATAVARARGAGLLDVYA